MPRRIAPKPVSPRAGRAAAARSAHTLTLEAGKSPRQKIKLAPGDTLTVKLPRGKYEISAPASGLYVKVGGTYKTLFGETYLVSGKVELKTMANVNPGYPTDFPLTFWPQKAGGGAGPTRVRIELGSLPGVADGQPSASSGRRVGGQDSDRSTPRSRLELARILGGGQGSGRPVPNLGRGFSLGGRGSGGGGYGGGGRPS